MRPAHFKRKDGGDFWVVDILELHICLWILWLISCLRLLIVWHIASDWKWQPSAWSVHAYLHASCVTMSTPLDLVQSWRFVVIRGRSSGASGTAFQANQQSIQRVEQASRLKDSCSLAFLAPAPASWWRVMGQLQMTGTHAKWTHCGLACHCHIVCLIRLFNYLCQLCVNKTMYWTFSLRPPDSSVKPVHWSTSCWSSCCSSYSSMGRWCCNM